MWRFHTNLKQCDEMWQKLLPSFVIIKCWNEPSYHHILSSQCIHVACFAWNGSILNTGLPIQYYSKGLPGPRYPKSNCRFCHNYSSYSFHIHNIMSILNVLSIFVNKRKFVRKNADRGRTTEHISSYCFKHIECPIPTHINTLPMYTDSNTSQNHK